MSDSHIDKTTSVECYNVCIDLTVQADKTNGWPHQTCHSFQRSMHLRIVLQHFISQPQQILVIGRGNQPFACFKARLPFIGVHLSAFACANKIAAFFGRSSGSRSSSP